MTLLEISQIWSLLHMVPIFLLFFRSKYPLRSTVITVTSITVALVTVCVAYIRIFRPENFILPALVFCTVPSLVLFYLLSEYRDGRFFFTFCLADTSFLWISQVTVLLDWLCGGTQVVLLISRLLMFPAFEVLLWKKLRRPYLELQAYLPGGWWPITAIAAGYYLLLDFSAAPMAYPMPGAVEIVRLVLILAMMPVTYLALLSALRRQMLYYDEKGKHDLLAAQVSALEGRIRATQAAEETVRIERHDLRHKLLTVEGMIRRGETGEALDYIHDLQGEVAYAQSEHWCAQPLLDAVFSSYFAQARRQGVRVKARLDIPQELGVDAGELSTVFANALENAIHACADLPEEKRELVCTCISHPSLMFEIANPYQGAIHFDDHGMPIAQTPGHGFGIRSISAFCEKHDACCACETRDGWFHLKIAL